MGLFAGPSWLLKKS